MIEKKPDARTECAPVAVLTHEICDVFPTQVLPNGVKKQSAGLIDPWPASATTAV